MWTMNGWKVGVAYERYGYIHVDASEAKTEEEAVAVANTHVNTGLFTIYR